MAKRKRLDLSDTVISSGLETKSAVPSPRARMPIAEVAGDTAGRAALEEVAREMTVAETEGRVIKKLPLALIERHHLSRDRLVIDEDDLASLMASISERGQQTPVEVVRLSGGKFGLISGLRRIEALARLGHDSVLALVRQPESSREAYQAMVEENEIRANLSFFERANLAVAAVGQGVYPDPKAAVAGLFAHATPAKRSKIARFVILRDALGKSLRFPTAIPEKLGLALSQAIEEDRTVATRLSEALRRTPPADAAAERKTLERALKKQAASGSGSATGPETLARGLKWQAGSGRVVLSGPALTDEFLEALKDFAVSHAKSRT